MRENNNLFFVWGQLRHKIDSVIVHHRDSSIYSNEVVIRLPLSIKLHD